jgi:hypothetical protein
MSRDDRVNWHVPEMLTRVVVVIEERLVGMPAKAVAERILRF